MIAAHVRVSTREQAVHGYGVDVQKAHIEKYLSLNKFNLDAVKWFSDEGKSASTLERPQLKKLLKVIKLKQVSHVVVYKLDRIFRNLKDQQKLIELFKENDVEFKCVTEEIDYNSANGKFTLNMRGSMAEWELDTVRERSLDGMVQSAYQGNFSVPRSPYGYDKVDKKLVINKEEAKVVKDIFQKASEGMSVWFIMQYLNERKDAQRKWREAAIYKILRNPIYYGCFSYYDIEIENHSPAIISKELFHRASKKRANSARKRNIYLFDRKGLHTQCDSIFINTSGSSGTGRIYNYLTCKTCGLHVPEREVLEAVEVAIKQYLKDKSKREDRDSVFTLQDKIEDVIKLFVNGLISQASYIKTLTMLEQKLERERILQEELDKDMVVLSMTNRENDFLLIQDVVDLIRINTTSGDKFITFRGGYEYRVDDELKVKKILKQK